MNKVIVFPDIDFADAEYESLELSKDDRLIIYINSWEEKKLKLIFINVLEFFYKQGDIVENLFQILGHSIFLKEALSRRFMKIPENHAYHLFQIEDIADFPFIQVVAESISITKE